MKDRWLHKSIALVLMATLVFYSVLSSFTVVDFVVHQDEIAKTLCVQKDNQIDCYGKCQLVRALKEDVGENQKSPIQNTERYQISVFLVSSITNPLNIPADNTISSSLSISNDKTISRSIEVPTPPPILMF